MNKTLKYHNYPSGQRIELVYGDITAETTDAIVNAANRYLEHGAGVAGAIVLKGGSQIQQESSQWVDEHGLVTHAEPAYTHAGELPCRFVIHAVGPNWGEGQEDEKLAQAVRGSLQVADRLTLKSIALPAISTGIFGFPIDRAAHVFLVSIQEYLATYPTSGLKLIRLVLYDQNSLQAFVKAWEQDDHFGS
jgi:O-acetyl-ADP-ribose deacetylase (regulator of RNase III)